MFGPPKDIEGQCNCRFEIADDYGDNHATMLCQLTPGHEREHEERWFYQAAGQRFEAILRWPASNTYDEEEPSPCEGCPKVDTCEGLAVCDKMGDKNGQ